MSGRTIRIAFLLLSTSLCGWGQDAPGSIRGLVMDGDFAAPLPEATITISDTNQKVMTTDQGNYVFPSVVPGTYTLVFSKDGYARQVRSNVLVSSARLTEVDATLTGDFTDMEEFVVEKGLDLSTNTEAGLLNLRFDSPALLDSISSDLISRAGASDAASALRLVSGASLQDGKSAVIRGLPDRYVSSQLNGVRLPSADEDKRAVELDQFPAVLLDSLQVSKTFTPDQQGDASGGAVNIKLRGIPKEELFFRISAQRSWNTQVSGEDDFLSYDGGGVDFWGRDGSDRGPQLDRLGAEWLGAAGVSRDEPPTDYKWSVTGGGNTDLGGGWRLGGLGSFFYERDSAFFKGGIDDSLWVTTPGGGLTPQYVQGAPQQEDFRTQLFDVTQGSQLVQWGGLAAVGIESDNHRIGATYLYTRTAEDVATLAEDTRGKEYFFPGHDPYDPSTPGHEQPDGAPYLRLETLEYTERTTETLQFRGHHRFETDPWGILGFFEAESVEIDWSAAFSTADLLQPDKRQFGSAWRPAREPIPGFILPATHRPFRPAANINLGNFQRIFKTIEEESEQYAFDVKLPFKQWSGDEGYLKTGYFSDSVKRFFDQDTFRNVGEPEFEAPFETFWSSVFPSQPHQILESEFDVDYTGELDVMAWYGMLELPLTKELKLIGGFRFEGTELSIINAPEEEATWFNPASNLITELNPGDADVAFEQDDVLPSIALDYRPIEGLTLRGAYNETIARQTFKEITPILQQEFLGGPIFIGNPGLGMSSVKNYDLRIDYVPLPGGLLSASWFRKDIKDPIENVQRVGTFSFTTAVNYPEGELSGFEFEARQDLGQVFDELAGLTLGGNATFIESEVQLPEDEIAGFNLPNILAPISSRDMTNAPEHIFNLFATYDLESTGTRVSLFYTITGDTLLAGAAQSNGNFVPSIYAKAFGTLNLSVDQKIGDHFKLQFQAKNLTNPKIERVYRSEYIDRDTLRSSSSAGVELSLTLSAEFTF